MDSQKKKKVISVVAVALILFLLLLAIVLAKKGEWLLSFGPSSPQTTLNGKNQTANVGSTLDESSLLDRMWAFFCGKR